MMKKYVLITGAAKRIGKAIALAFARKEFGIGLHYFNSKEEAQTTVKELLKFTPDVDLFQADLTRPEEINNLNEEIKAKGRTISLLVNSASVFPNKKLDNATVDDWDQTMQINLRAPWLLSKTLKANMQENSSIINITDSSVEQYWTQFPVYNISKAGLETLTRIMAKDYAPNIRVNAVAPGLIMKNEIPNDKWDKLIEKVPLKQAGSEEDIVNAVLFLEQNKYINGATIVVDGGYRLI